MTPGNISKTGVDKAGTLLRADAPQPVSPDELTRRDRAYDLLAEWRALHAYPLEQVARTLRRRARSIDESAFVGQRLKRLPSIREKLTRQGTMGLSQMQDIAGCRVVMNSVEDVYRLKEIYEHQSSSGKRTGPQLVPQWTKDYILSPKDDGYRSVHLVVRYETGLPNAQRYNGLRVEIQLRSKLQHAWAMAVETASAITGEALKSGSGRDPWLRFFRLMGSAIALKEHLPMVPETDDLTLYGYISEVVEQLGVVQLFEGMKLAVHASGTEMAQNHPEDIFVIQLDAKDKEVRFTVFPREDVGDAVTQYSQLERTYQSSPDVHVLLVSVGSMKELREAYPSYFLDATHFVELIKECCSLSDILGQRENLYLDHLDVDF